MIDLLSYKPDEISSWKGILAALSVWSSFYLVLRRLLRGKSPEYISRIVAGTHGILITFLGCRECFSDWNFSEPNQRTTVLQTLILVTSLGYFLEDTIWCIYYQTETFLMLAHHLFSCFAVYRLLLMKRAGGQATCGLGVLEMSNPCLQMRWFVRFHGYQKTIMFYIAEGVFIITFLLLRVLLGTQYLLMVLMEPNTWEFRALTTTIYIISWMFVVNIIKYVQYKYCTVRNIDLHRDNRTSINTARQDL